MMFVAFILPYFLFLFYNVFTVFVQTVQSVGIAQLIPIVEPVGLSARNKQHGEYAQQPYCFNSSVHNDVSFCTDVACLNAKIIISRRSYE